MSSTSNAARNGHRATELPAEQFPHFVAARRGRVEAALEDWLPVSAAPGTGRFNEAVRYAVFPGGKRLRPHLALIASALGGASDEQALMHACAVEFIHTSSLVLDDLPSMDDAGLRRGRPALHLAYGEGTALLVAVALLNQSYALYAGSARGGAQTARLPRLLAEVAACVGASGMIAGQAVEMALSGSPADDSVLASCELKTTGLMRLMMVAGGILSDAPEGDVEALAAFGESLGRAYQIYDDLADAWGDQQSTGKSVGQDLRHLRPTVVRGLSRVEARELSARVVESGKDALSRFGDQPGALLLRSAADHIIAHLAATFSEPPV